MQYNYTLNPEGIYGAIKYMYTYYPDPNNKSHIREEFINVSIFCISLMFRFSQKASKITRNLPLSCANCKGQYISEANFLDLISTKKGT